MSSPGFFQAVYSIPIPTYGTQSLTLNLGLQRKFHWGFNIECPIIGADFHHNFNLLIDMNFSMT